MFALSSIPLISIVEATCERAESLGFQTVGLFGTRFYRTPIAVRRSFWNDGNGRTGRMRLILGLGTSSGE